jgi:hypothetical protein
MTKGVGYLGKGWEKMAKGVGYLGKGKNCNLSFKRGIRIQV